MDSAPDGRAALRKLGDKYYAAIITDIDMPVMNGVEFFKEACRAYPGVGSRFIFFTAITDPRLVQLLSENGGRENAFQSLLQCGPYGPRWWMSSADENSAQRGIVTRRLMEE